MACSPDDKLYDPHVLSWCAPSQYSSICMIFISTYRDNVQQAALKSHTSSLACFKTRLCRIKATSRKASYPKLEFRTPFQPFPCSMHLYTFPSHASLLCLNFENRPCVVVDRGVDQTEALQLIACLQHLVHIHVDPGCDILHVQALVCLRRVLDTREHLPRRR